MKKRKTESKKRLQEALTQLLFEKDFRTLLFLIYVKKQASIEEHFTYTIKIKMI